MIENYPREAAPVPGRCDCVGGDARDCGGVTDRHRRPRVGPRLVRPPRPDEHDGVGNFDYGLGDVDHRFDDVHYGAHDLHHGADDIDVMADRGQPSWPWPRPDPPLPGPPEA